jgi:hypothetical protein
MGGCETACVARVGQQVRVARTGLRAVAAILDLGRANLEGGGPGGAVVVPASLPGD